MLWGRQPQIGSFHKNYGKSYSELFLTLKSAVASPERRSASNENPDLLPSFSLERSSNDSAVVAQHLVHVPIAGDKY